MSQEESTEGLRLLGPPYLKGWRLATVILSLYLGAFVMALDTNIINVAVPKITTNFYALEDVAWYGSAYLLTVASLRSSIFCFIPTTIFRFLTCSLAYSFVSLE